MAFRGRSWRISPLMRFRIDEQIPLTLQIPRISYLAAPPPGTKSETSNARPLLDFALT